MAEKCVMNGVFNSVVEKEWLAFFEEEQRSASAMTITWKKCMTDIIASFKEPHCSRKGRRSRGYARLLSSLGEFGMF